MYVGEPNFGSRVKLTLRRKWPNSLGPPNLHIMFSANLSEKYSLDDGLIPTSCGGDHQRKRRPTRCRRKWFCGKHLRFAHRFPLDIWGEKFPAKKTEIISIARVVA